MKKKTHSGGRLRFERLEDRRVLDGQLAAALTGAADAPAIVGGEGEDISPVLPGRFADSGELRDFLTRQAIHQYADMFGQKGWPGFWWYRNDVVTGVVEDTALVPVADHSQTNNQVAGVEEGDIAETDGQFLYLAGEGNVTVIDARSDDLSVASRFPVDGYTTDLYLDGDRLIVLSHSWSGYEVRPMAANAMLVDRAMPYEPPESELLISVLDVSSPSEPTLVERFTLDGDYVDSRMIAGTLYLVSQDEFQLPPPKLLCDEGTIAGDPRMHLMDVMPIWEDGTGRSCVHETQEQYLARIGDQVLDLALPTFTTMAEAGETVDPVWLTEPEAIYKPVLDGQSQLLSISAFDVSADDPALLRSTGMPISWSSEIYVSAEHLYVVEPRWDSGSERMGNSIYQFDLGTADGTIDMVARGRVQGTILNQFAMDEYDGTLRIVTQQGTWQEPVTSVTVLGRQGDELRVIGQIDDIAPSERLYSVRFIQDRAYVVTFGPEGGVWFDPLFTIDLSDPANPQVQGELEIPGFSNYLHLVGDHYLLGLGRNADPETGRALEPQVSLFDVSDFSNPIQLDTDSFAVGGWSWSEAFTEHHAVSFFPESGVLAVPMSVWGRAAWDGSSDRHGLWVFQINTGADVPAESRIETLGTIGHDSPVRRSLRIADRLYSISQETVQVHPLTDPSTAIDVLYWARSAQDDFFRVRQEAGETPFDVLANDVLDGDSGSVPQIIAVTQPEWGGQVRIADDGLSLLFTPTADAEGWLNFTYTLDNGDLGVSTATVTVEVVRVPVERRMTELALKDLAERLDVPPEAITVGKIERVIWPDGCLGIAPTPDTACIRALTPGFRIALIHDGDRFVYHTDMADRVLLAVSEVLPDLIEIRVEAVDAAGQVITTIEAGESFVLNVYVQDLRSEPEGVYAAYLDILYYARRVAVDGDIVFGSEYANGQSGEADRVGLVDELGAFSGVNTLDGEEHLLASVPFVAKRSGIANFMLNPAESIGHDVLIYGINETVPLRQVVYQGAQLEITEGWRNEDRPEDVNGDGSTTPNDALTLINDLNLGGPRRLAPVREAAGQAAGYVHHYLDVNGDGVISASDALWVINTLNQRAAQALAGVAEEDPDAFPFEAPLDSLAAWVDWASLEERLTDESWAETLESFEVTPEQAVDLLHRTLAPVDPRQLRERGLAGGMEANPWQTLDDLQIGAAFDGTARDRLFAAADQVDRLVAGLDIEHILPELGEHFQLEAARRAFRDKLASGLAAGILSTT